MFYSVAKTSFHSIVLPPSPSHNSIIYNYKNIQFECMEAITGTLHLNNLFRHLLFRILLGLWFGECFGVFESRTSRSRSQRLSGVLNCMIWWSLCVCVCACQALEWIQEAGEVYLTTHTSPGDSVEKSQELLKEYDEFRISAKVQRHKHFPSFSSISC